VRPFVALLGTSTRQALPIRRTILLVLLALSPTLIYVFATTGRTEASAFEGAVEVAVATYFALVLPIVSIVIASGVLGNERRDLTLSFVTLRPIPRWAIAVAKLLAAFVASSVIAVAGAIALGGTHAARFGSAGLLAGLTIGALVAVAAYVAVYVPLGFLTDRAVVIGIAYLLVFENGAAFLLTGLAALSPWRLGVSVFADITSGVARIVEDQTAPLNAAQAMIALGAYFIASIAVTSWMLMRRDLA
jgi:ABC-2 type transport system permease protein